MGDLFHFHFKSETLLFSYKGEISPFGRDDKNKNVGQWVKTIVFQGFLWGCHSDEHSEEKSRCNSKFLASFDMTHLRRRGFALRLMLRLI